MKRTTREQKCRSINQQAWQTSQRRPKRVEYFTSKNGCLREKLEILKKAAKELK